VRILLTSRARLERLLAQKPDNRPAQHELLWTLTVLGQALDQVGRHREAVAAARAAVDGRLAALQRKPADPDLRRTLAESQLAYGEVLEGAGNGAGARTAYLAAVASVDSIAHASQQTDLLAISAAALLHLDRAEAARPQVEDLLRRGYRRPRFLALVAARGIALPV
jgi:tetratricopeptide (TPR) repeat protein